MPEVITNCLHLARKAGLVERYHIHRTHLGFDSGVVLAARYTGGGCLDRNTLWPALAALLECHRALSTQVYDATSRRPRFIYLGSVNLSKVVHFHHSDTEPLEAVLESYLMQPLEYGTQLPLWRLGVLRDNTLIFKFDRAIADGQSGLAFHRLLMAALNFYSKRNHVSSLSTEDIIPVPEHLELIPPVEKMTAVSLPFSVLCYQLYRLYAPISWTKLGQAWTGNNTSKHQTGPTTTRLWQLPSDQTRKLLKICHDHDTDLAAFLHTAAIVVLSCLLHCRGHLYKYVSTEITVSLRRFTFAPSVEFCNHVSTNRSYPPLMNISDIPGDWNTLAAHFPWEVWSAMASTIHERAVRAREEVGSIKLLFGRSKWFSRNGVGKKRESALLLTNLGHFSGPTQERTLQKRNTDKWSIDRIFLGQADSHLGPAIKMGVVESEDGSLGISWNWAKGVIEDPLGEDFVAGFRQLSEAVISLYGCLHFI